jgi:aminopeptidase N
MTENMSIFQIRIWARKQAIAEGQGDYALEKTGPILEFFENYYSSSYPLTKSGNT